MTEHGEAMKYRCRKAINSPQRQRGSAVIEYSIVTFFVVVLLISTSETQPVAQLMQAIKDVYEAFSFALSVSFPTPNL